MSCFDAHSTKVHGAKVHSTEVQRIYQFYQEPREHPNIAKIYCFLFIIMTWEWCNPSPSDVCGSFSRNCLSLLVQLFFLKHQTPSKEEKHKKTGPVDIVDLQVNPGLSGVYILCNLKLVLHLSMSNNTTLN